MKKKILNRCGLLALTVMVLNACSSMKQDPSPIETGAGSNSGQVSGVGGDYVDNNPYGTSQIGGTGQVVTPPTTYPSTGAGTYVGSYAPVDVNAATHTVVSGDTVYNISKRYSISQDSVRSWNGLGDNNIRLGQVLRVKPAGYVAPATTHPVVNTTVPVVVTTTPTTTTPAAVNNNAAGTRTVAGITWMRPTVGKILNGFNSETKGINYGGQMGQAVVAAADGKVVYSGTGLRTYGNLIIIQHNQMYLTAYGNNKQILLKEGAQVKRGQTIAYMGNSDSDRVQLHFEVREQGKPVDPSRFIP